jgi:hypothetical protein
MIRYASRAFLRAASGSGPSIGSMLTLEPRFKTCASSIAARVGSTMRQRIISAIASLSFIGAFRGFSLRELCEVACAGAKPLKGEDTPRLCAACNQPTFAPKRSGLRLVPETFPSRIWRITTSTDCARVVGSAGCHGHVTWRVRQRSRFREGTRSNHAPTSIYLYCAGTPPRC